MKLQSQLWKLLYTMTGSLHKNASENTVCYYGSARDQVRLSSNRVVK